MVFAFFWLLRTDFNGSKAREPGGFGGAIMTVVIIAAQLFIYYKAGAFSLIFR